LPGKSISALPMKAYFSSMKVKKGKTLKLIGTFAIIAIALILIAPFFANQQKETEKSNRKTAVIKMPANPYITELAADFEKEINKLLQKSGTPGAAIAIVKDSTIVYIKGFGLKASNAKDSVDQHTVFRIASVSKCFASFLTGTLIEDSLLHWKDPVIKYMPDFSLISPEQTKLLDISHVLSHTTGLPYHTYTNLVEEGTDLDVLLSRLKEVPMSTGVGREYSYQNVAYSLISKVIQKATGKTYEEMMRERVFGPLGMKDASIDYQTLMSNKNIAKPHKLAKRQWVPAKITNTYYNVAPAGGVNASIDDMAHWMIALLGYRENVISFKTLRYLYTPVIEARSKNRNYRKMERYTNSYYGLGWRILHYPSDTLVYHGGYVNGYRSEVALDPNDRIAICILANAPGQLADNGIPVFFKLFNQYREKIIAWENRQRIPQQQSPI
jgi:beta-lactamase class C